MLDANACRENAKRCMAQAAETTDPRLKEHLAEIAQGWARLAADYANLNDRLAEDNAERLPKKAGGTKAAI
jgi:molecular chaperone GrpE (heat shock protein)